MSRGIRALSFVSLFIYIPSQMTHGLLRAVPQHGAGYAGTVRAKRRATRKSAKAVGKTRRMT